MRDLGAEASTIGMNCKLAMEIIEPISNRSTDCSNSIFLTSGTQSMILAKAKSEKEI
jgi:hypothetical protein